MSKKLPSINSKIMSKNLLQNHDQKVVPPLGNKIMSKKLPLN